MIVLGLALESKSLRQKNLRLRKFDYIMNHDFTTVVVKVTIGSVTICVLVTIGAVTVFVLVTIGAVMV